MNPLEFITQNQTLVTFILSGLGAFITRLVEKSKLRKAHKKQLEDMKKQMEALEAENQALKQITTQNN